MKRAILNVLFLMALVSVINAQTAEDALRYSRIFYGGTARFTATGGAFGAIGADFSTLATNPAGIGLYKSSEYTLSLTGMFDNSKSLYNGVENSGHDGNFALGNVGFVASLPTAKHKSNALRYLNFGFGLNRQNDFNQQTFVSGPNHTSSMLNVYTDVLNSQPGYNPNLINYDYPFDIGLAYNTDLIYYDSLGHQYASDMPHGGAYQEKVITTSGSINEMDFSLGGNVNDKLYFGFTLGVPWIRYYQSSQYFETDRVDTIYYFKSFQYNYTYQTNGTGVNFKAGLVYRPANWVRVGVAVHTPTYYPGMTDFWATSMYSAFDNYNTYSSFSPQGSYDYRLTTPFRAIGSFAFFIGQIGFISGEYEYANYNQARYNSSGDSYTDVNNTIKTSYTAPLNFRLGTEWRVKFMRIRGGFSYNGSPEKGGSTGERYVISGGVGYFSKHFFVDASYQFANQSSDYYMYEAAYVNPANVTLRTSTFNTTFGLRL